MTIRTFTTGVLCGMVALFAGCPMPPAGNNNGNGNGNGNGNSGNGNITDANQNLNADTTNQNAPTDNANSPDANNNNSGTAENQNSADNTNQNTGGGNENANAVGNSNENASANENANSAGPPLSMDQKQSVESATLQLKQISAIYGLFAAFARQPSFSFDLLPIIGAAGDCPQLAWVSDVNSSTAVVGLTVPPGMTSCTGDLTDDRVFAGNVGLQPFRTDTHVGTLTFSGASLDCMPLTGSGALTCHGGGGQAVTLQGNITVAYGNDVSAAGPVTLLLHPDGRVVVNADDLALTSPGGANTVDLVNVTFNAITGDSFAASSGIATVVSVSPPLHIEYTAQSPASGEVLVRVGENNPVSHVVPGLGG